MPATAEAVPAAVRVPREALDYPVMFNPGPAVRRWVGLRRGMYWSFGSFVVGLAIWAAIWWFNREDWTATMWWILGASIGLSLILTGRSVFRAVAARRELRLVAEGLALGIGRGGLFADQRFLPWVSVATLEARSARVGQTARLIIRPMEGAPLGLPLDYLAASPADLDGAIRALSGGRAHVDLSRLDV